MSTFALLGSGGQNTFGFGNPDDGINFYLAAEDSQNVTVPDNMNWAYITYTTGSSFLVDKNPITVPDTTPARGKMTHNRTSLPVSPGEKLYFYAESAGTVCVVYSSNNGISQ